MVHGPSFALLELVLLDRRCWEGNSTRPNQGRLIGEGLGRRSGAPDATQALELGVDSNERGGAGGG